MPKVTVAIASYNHAPFVGEAIESVLSQKDCNFELIIVDDGSKDGTVKEIKKFKDSRLRLIEFKSNQGACTAFRHAIEAGTGEYVAILNSDDVFMPGKLKKQTAFLDAHPSISALFGLPILIDEASRELLPNSHPFQHLFNQMTNRTRHQWLNHFFYRSNVLCHPSLLIRRFCYQDVGHYDHRLSQIPDYDFWVKLLLKHEIHILQEPLVRFRILAHEANASAPSVGNFRCFKWEIPHVLSHYTKIPSLKEYIKIFPEDEAFIQSFSESDAPYLIPYALAKKSLEIADGKKEHFHPTLDKSTYSLFALQTLFPLYNQKEFVEKIVPKVGMNAGQFSQLAKRYGIFEMGNPPPTFKEKMRNKMGRIYRSVRKKVLRHE